MAPRIHDAIMIKASDAGPVCTFDAIAGVVDSVFSSQRAFTAKSSYTIDHFERKRTYRFSFTFWKRISSPAGDIL